MIGFKEVTEASVGKLAGIRPSCAVSLKVDRRMAKKEPRLTKPLFCARYSAGVLYVQVHLFHTKLL